MVIPNSEFALMCQRVRAFEFLPSEDKRLSRPVTETTGT